MQRRYWSDLRSYIVVVLAFSLGGIGQLLVECDWPLVHTINDQLGDVPEFWSAKRVDRQRDDIVLVIIDEDTLREYPIVSPLPRVLLAKLIREISQYEPRVIGIDAVIDRKTEDDLLLVDAIRAASATVVLGTIDDRAARRERSRRALFEGLAAQEDFIASSGARAGHIWLESRIGLLASNTDAVRLVGESFIGTPSRASFSAEVASIAGARRIPDTRTISWLRPPADNAIPLFAELRVPRHHPSSLRSGHPILPAGAEQLIRGRVVLLGADLSDRDQHVTPLNLLDGAKTPGLAIHAQAVAQYLDGNRSVYVLNTPASFVLAVLAAFAAYGLHLWSIEQPIRYIRIAGIRVDLRSALTKASPLAIGVVALIVLVFGNVQLPVRAMVFAWISMLIAASALKTLEGWLHSSAA